MTVAGPQMTSFAATLGRADATPISTEGPLGVSRPGRAGQASPTGTDFADRVRELVEGANAQQVEAQQAAESYANGQSNDMHGTMIALEQADISLRLVSNIRSRLVEAYREVMRMGA